MEEKENYTPKEIRIFFEIYTSLNNTYESILKSGLNEQIENLSYLKIVNKRFVTEIPKNVRVECFGDLESGVRARIDHLEEVSLNLQRDLLEDIVLTLGNLIKHRTN
ncbi:hypothetical protein HY212_07610 [Candidatus Pacearchaeota archaeon]|nr:hypothetical protein [Candidatus Pacearchaeota archaeon]